MGMKDQFQEKKHQAGQKMGEARERAGQRGQQQGQHGGRPQGQQPERSRSQNPRDIEGTEREMEERFDADYDA